MQSSVKPHRQCVGAGQAMLGQVGIEAQDPAASEAAMGDGEFKDRRHQRMMVRGVGVEMAGSYAEVFRIGCFDDEQAIRNQCPQSGVKQPEQMLEGEMLDQMQRADGPQ